MTKTRWYTLAVVGVHALVAGLHGAAHVQLEIRLSPLQMTFVVLVISLAPLVALGLVWGGWVRVGGAVLLTSMAGALAFGIVNHFILHSPDHVSQVAAGFWGDVFRMTAYLLALIEAIGCWCGAWLMAGAGRRASL
jgi:hypothetical protein